MIWVIILGLVIIGLWPFLSQVFTPLKQFLVQLCTQKDTSTSSQAHQQRLETWYKPQAQDYDSSRSKFLRGRQTMISLCASVLPRPRIWIDLGGGTGNNLEFMAKIMDLNSFTAIHLVDLSPSLAQKAQEKVDRNGWTNVHIHVMDASSFECPDKVDLVTMSYSLTMMESYFDTLDKIHNQWLSPTGILGIADFFTAPNRSDDITRHQSLLMRTFWRLWFSLDNVYLDPDRRAYLDYKFKPLIQLNCSHLYIPPFIRVPYYVFVGAAKESALQPLDVNAFPKICKRNTHEEEDETFSIAGDE